MRDIAILAVVLPGILLALRHPWVGILLWTWLSLMNPHRLAFGFAYDAPLAAMAAGATFVGMVLPRDQRTSPFKGAPPVLLMVFMVWMTLSWLLGFDPAHDQPQWEKVMKIDLMVLVGLALLHSKRHIMALAWICAGSLALLGAKGGVFTILTGGNYRVWGPPGTFIEDNNELALALIMTVPLLRFLQMQLASYWSRRVMSVAMLLCVVAAVGSYSRGALLAIGAMALVLWWRGRNKAVNAVVFVTVGTALAAFMPDQWTQRMNTIESYDEDRSALGRISAWWNAWGVAKHHLFGAGFEPGRPELFALYSPYPDYIHAAHSIYFQVLGNHGFMGLFLFLAIWVTTWNSAAWLRKHGGRHVEAKWSVDLGSMCQVALAGYAVGGAFLSLSYFDLPYNIMMLVVLTRVWVQTRGWERESDGSLAWLRVPGMAPHVAR